MKKLIVASNNSHKISEIKEILSGIDLNIVSLKEVGINIDVEEDGKTFKENAYKKANEIKDYLLSNGNKNFMVMADDSGIEIDYLGGEPGVYSARYAGEHGNDKKNNQLVLDKLKDVEDKDRRANFVCSIVVLTDNNKEIYSEGRVDGFITREEHGKDGFGYDPLFYVPETKKTFAEMSSEEKNSISHRGRALENLRLKLSNYI